MRGIPSKQRLQECNGIANLPKQLGTLQSKRQLDVLSDTGIGGFSGIPLIEAPLEVPDSPVAQPRPAKPRQPIADQFRTLERANQAVRNQRNSELIISVNGLLQLGEWKKAEYALGRDLTTAEIIAKSITNAIDPHSGGQGRAPSVGTQTTRPPMLSVAGQAGQNIASDGFKDDKGEEDIPDLQAVLESQFQQAPPVTPPKPAKPPAVKPTKPAQYIQSKPTPPGKVFNPKSGNFISANGSLHKALIADGTITSPPKIPVKLKPKIKSEPVTPIKIEGQGLTPYKRSRPDLKLNLVPLGKYAIDLNQLDQNIASVVYPSSRRKHPDIKNRKIGAELKSALTSMMSGLTPSLQGLKPDEIKYLETLAHLAKIQKRGDLTVKPKRVSTKALADQFRVLTGEISAGNDSRLIRQQLTTLLALMVSKGLIDEGQALSATKEYIK